MVEVLFLIAAIAGFVIFAFGDRIRAQLGDKARSPDPTRDATPFDDGPLGSPPDLPMPDMGTTVWGGVFLECGDMQAVLIVLPVSAPEAIDDIPTAVATGTAISAMVVVNEPGPGYLWGSVICERLGIARDSVFASDPTAPIDRTPDSAAPNLTRDWAPDSADPPKSASALDPLRRGNLTVQRRRGGGVVARWDYSGTEVCAVIGAGLSIASFARPPYANYVIGSMAPVDTKKAPSSETWFALRKFVLLANVPPDTSETMGYIWSNMGKDVSIVRRKQASDPAQIPEDFEGEAALLAALDADASVLGSVLEQRSDAEIERVLDSLATIGRLDDAERLAAATLEQRGLSGTAWFYRGLAAFLAGDPELAIESYRAAAASEPPHLEAWCNLASVLAETGKLDDAIEAADRAVAALPDDPFSVQVGVGIRYQRGDVSGAREFLRQHGAALDPSLRATLEAELDDPNLPANPPAVRHRYPRLAERLVALGESYLEDDQPERALEPLERAVAMDPSNISAARTLAVVLSRLGRDKDG